MPGFVLFHTQRESAVNKTKILPSVLILMGKWSKNKQTRVCNIIPGREEKCIRNESNILDKGENLSQK